MADGAERRHRHFLEANAQMATNRNNDNQNQNQGRQGSGRDQSDGSMSVREAGQKGGERVRELVEEGKQNEGGSGRSGGGGSGGRTPSR
ncbi:MAG TPA: hypothetical protein VEY50_03900 [Lysobacter sp.]|nr:hypothetical protein [Lysobacter sp.]